MSEVGIIGLGRFGKFWVSVLNHAHTVYGFTRTIPQEAPCPLLSFEQICKLPVIFLCVPMRSMSEMLLRMAPHLQAGTLIVDTCSVKVEPVKWMQEILPDSVNIMATHPMFGPESAKEGLAGLPMMMHPVRMSTTEYQYWLGFFKMLGIMVVEMSPEEHDKQAAMSQALTHILGRTLNTMGIQDCPIGTLWYRKLLAICKQVAKDSEELFYDMQMLNPYAENMRSSFLDSWNNVCKSLTDTDKAR